jgi:hypothetical protein
MAALTEVSNIGAGHPYSSTARDAFRWPFAEFEMIRPCVSCEVGRRSAGLFCLSCQTACLAQQSRIGRTLGYPRLHSVLARSPLLGG